MPEIAKAFSFNPFVPNFVPDDEKMLPDMGADDDLVTEDVPVQGGQGRQYCRVGSNAFCWNIQASPFVPQPAGQGLAYFTSADGSKQANLEVRSAQENHGEVASSSARKSRLARLRDGHGRHHSRVRYRQWRVRADRLALEPSHFLNATFVDGTRVLD